MKKLIISVGLIIFTFPQESQCRLDSLINSILDINSIWEQLIYDEENTLNVYYTVKAPGYEMNMMLDSIEIKNFPFFQPDKPTINYNYNIYYYNDGKIIIPLAVKELRTEITRDGNIVGTTFDFVVSLDKFKEMSTSLDSTDTLIIKEFINNIKEKERKGQTVRTFNDEDKDEKDIVEILDRDQYYKQFAEVVNNHRYPLSSKTEVNKKEVAAAKTLPPDTSKVPPPDTSETSSPYTSETSSQDISKFYIEFSAPGWNISGSHIILQNGNFLGLNNFGLEIGLRKDRILNLLEYQNPVINFGGFFYCDFGNTPFALDIGIFGQKNFHNKKLLNNKKFLGIEFGWPVFDFSEEVINKADGITVDAHILGSLGNFKLPFLNLYWSHGMDDFKNPVFRKDINPETKASYYSLNQVEISASFYWNVDRNNYNKLRLDIGSGSYDILKVLYNSNNTILSKTKENKSLKWLPLIGFEYIHSSGDNDNTTRFGSSIRYFDSRLSFGTWLKLLSIGYFEMRLEEYYISESFKKVLKEWEHKGSSNMMQLVFRFGLN